MVKTQDILALVESHLIDSHRQSLMSPWIHVSSGQTISIDNSRESPFKVGEKISFSVSLAKDSWNLKGTLSVRQMSDIRILPFKSSAISDRQSTMEVPLVAQAECHFKNTEPLPLEHGFALATLQPGQPNDVLLIAIELRLATNEPSPISIRDSLNQFEVAKTDKRDTSPWLMILGPITKGYSSIIKAPSHGEILRIAEQSAQWHKLRKQLDSLGPDRKIDIQVTCTPLGEICDPPKFVPLIGEAKLYHEYYRCTLSLQDVSITIYVDHQHYHLMASASGV